MDMAICMVAHGEAPDRAISVLGEGWVAEEALGISLYCASTAESLKEGVIMAVNITGDSDSTGPLPATCWAHSMAD
jgi:ADP-ribosyl-[dinitrogen reductase] hydrolase